MKRVVYSSVLGILFGLLCAWMATIFQPVPITPLILLGTVYNRFLIGLFIGLLGGLQLVRGDLTNALVRGGVLGALIGLGGVLMCFGGSSLSFVVPSVVYGLLIDVLVTRFVR